MEISHEEEHVRKIQSLCNFLVEALTKPGDVILDAYASTC
jgi:hypothetical protein